MAHDIALDEEFRRFDAALDKSQQSIEAAHVPDEVVDELLEAAPIYRNDPEYRALLGLGGA